MQNEFAIECLGERTIDSPFKSSFFIPEDSSVLLDATTSSCKTCKGSPTVLEQAGPRKKVFFNGSDVKAAIVTCGGLCPGLNDVIRATTMVLWHRYGVNNIVGLKYGYEGLIDSFNHPIIQLDPEIVSDIHQNGGTVLGSSRGNQDVPKMVDFLARNRINMLFTIGGDGTQRGALEISQEIKKRGLKIAVVGIPKTIDNDLSYTERTFGFETAVAMSKTPITCAHMEAKGARNGVGLVKLMGRDSGFVAAYAALASSEVNLVLLPEVPFKMEKMMSFLEARLARKAHVVIVAAEGAGQDLVTSTGTDASGNKIHGDIGIFLKKAIADYFKSKKIDVNIKYIDPSYTIRSAPASPDDSVFCFQISESAVHAAMTGRTAMVMGMLNGHFVHIPMAKAVKERKKIDTNGALWHSVLDNTGQPSLV